MSNNKKDRHDSDDTFDDEEISFEEDEFVLSVDELERRLRHTEALEFQHTKKRQKHAGKSNKRRKRRVEEWDDDWVDPEDDLMYGYTGKSTDTHRKPRNYD